MHSSVLGAVCQLLLIPEYSGINQGQRIQDRSKTAHRKPPVKCFLTDLDQAWCMASTWGMMWVSWQHCILGWASSMAHNSMVSLQGRNPKKMSDKAFPWRHSRWSMPTLTRSSRAGIINWPGEGISSTKFNSDLSMTIVFLLR